MRCYVVHSCVICLQWFDGMRVNAQLYDDVIHTTYLLCFLILFTVLQDGDTALMLACVRGHIDSARQLVRCGNASVNTRNDVSATTTRISLLCSIGSVAIVRIYSTG